MWLPRREAIPNPNTPKIRITSAPERLLGFGMCWWRGFQLVARQDRRVFGKPALTRVFALKPQRHGLPQITHQLIECGCLCNHRQIEAFRDEIFLASADEA
jgi:hypothetical protein